MKILAIDYGAKRIGLAINLTDFLAKEYGVINHDNDTIKTLLDIVKKEEIQKIVLGLPVNMDASQSDASEKVKYFAQNLKKHLSIPIIFEDERLTSSQAEIELKSHGLSVEEIKKRVDSYAAKLILEQYLG